MSKRCLGVLLGLSLLFLLCGCQQREPVINTVDNPPEVGPENGIYDPKEMFETPTPMPETPNPSELMPPTTVGPDDSEDTRVTELPDAQTVSAEETPLLYDFTHGCLDWHVPIHRDSLASDFYIMRHKTCPEVLHCDWYVTQSGFTTPPLGSKITSVEIDPQYLDSIEKLIAKFPSERRITEGEWELLILNTYDENGVYGFNSDGKWGLMTPKMFVVLQGYTDGLFSQRMQSGAGWPTEWLRKEPYATLLMQDEGIYIDDPWWDTWTYQKHYMLASSETGEYRGYMTTPGEDRYVLYDSEYNQDHRGLELSGYELLITMDTDSLFLKDAPELYYEVPNENELF